MELRPSGPGLTAAATTAAGDASAPSPAQRLARRFAPLHNLAYYAPEVRAFTDAGMRGWWMAYFAYRAAPLGAVAPEVVVATFYNFAPRMVARAIPAAWRVLPPERALALRLDLVARALDRVFPGGGGGDGVEEAAELARRSVEGCDAAGRALFAAHGALPWPAGPPLLALWHACTLLREHRGDAHVVALAAAGVDGVECHVLMAARGHGNRASILPIRGWSDAEWDAAEGRLRARGWLDEAGALTPAGRAGRRAIEDRTDALAAEPCRRLGPGGLDRLCRLLDPLAAAVHDRGGVPATWPPPHLLRPDR